MTAAGAAGGSGWLRDRPGDRRQLTVGAFPVEIARHRRARRYVLRLTPEGTLRLTVPRGSSIAGGLAFARRQAAWIAREHQRQRDRAAAWTHGTAIWWRGERVMLDIADGVVRFGDERVPIARDDDPPPAIWPADLLEIAERAAPPGAAVHTASDVRAAIEAHAIAIARRELPPRCLALAAKHGVAITRVSVRNQRSRWGACSPSGVITLNWRLVQMPPFVAEYVLLHELMHVHQPNHSVRFWRAVERVCPSWRDAERWLKQRGREIL